MMSMKPCKITDRLLPYLAIAHVLLMPLTVWASWQPLALAWTPHKGDASAWVMNILLYGIGLSWIILSIIATAFFKRWRAALLCYIPYAIWILPAQFKAISLRFQPRLLQWPNLGGTVWTYTCTAVVLITLCTSMVYIYEAYYPVRKKPQ